MSTQVDKNVQISKDKENPKEEINHSYANGFISKKGKTYKKEKPHEDKHATFAPCLLTQLEQVAHILKKLNQQNQGVCTNTEAQVEDTTPSGITRDSKGSTSIEQRANTTDN